MLAPIIRGARLPAADWVLAFISWGGLLWGRLRRPHSKRFSSSRDRWYSHRSIKEATCSCRGNILNFLWARKKKASTNACRHIPVDREMLSVNSQCPREAHPKPNGQQELLCSPHLHLGNSTRDQHTGPSSGPGTLNLNRK